MTSPRNLFYAQSGGVTAVINVTAAAVIENARIHHPHIGKVYAGVNGILGALNNQLFDCAQLDTQQLTLLKQTPGGAFGSCRHKMGDLATNLHEYEKLLAVFKKHNIGYFLYNGGGDSQLTAQRISEYAQQQEYPLQCIGIPKTIDNDLPITDNCPGFGSVAKFVATSIRECNLDLRSMSANSTKVFVMEVMGRHTGWIAAATGLAQTKNDPAPHIIIFPEIPFQPAQFFTRVNNTVKKYGHCCVVVAEGAKSADGTLLSCRDERDHFGHVQLGGVGPCIAQLITRELGYKHHWTVLDYVQRAARHIAAKTDVEQAYAVGKAAVYYAVQGKNNIMVTLQRTSNSPYSWKTSSTPLHNVAGKEKMMPHSFIDNSGFAISDEAREYFLPLIAGEAYPSYHDHLPEYLDLFPLPTITCDPVSA